MDVLDTISFNIDLIKEQYISVIELISMVKSTNDINTEVAVSFLEATCVANLCTYSIASQSTTDCSYEKIEIDPDLDNEMYHFIHVEYGSKNDDMFHDKYKESLDKLSSVYWKRLDLLNISEIVMNTNIVKRGKKHILQYWYSDIIDNNNDLFLSFPQITQNTILDFLTSINPNQLTNVIQQLACEKIKVAQLMAEKAEERSTNNLMIGMQTIEQCEHKLDEEFIKELADANEEVEKLKQDMFKLEKKLKQQAEMSADDQELSTRSQNLAAKIILALLDIAGLDKDSPPYQYDNLRSNNSLIHDQIKANGMKVGQQKIGHWLNLAINQTTDE